MKLNPDLLIEYTHNYVDLNKDHVDKLVDDCLTIDSLVNVCFVVDVRLKVAWRSVSV